MIGLRRILKDIYYHGASILLTHKHAVCRRCTARKLQRLLTRAWIRRHAACV